MSKELEEILDRWKLYISLTKNFSNKDMELLKIEEIEELLDYISNLQQENQQLKELCNKYEEEHKKEFKIWLQGQKVLAELEEWLKIERINNAFIDEDTIMEVQLKIQELKEKYK